MEQEDIPGFSSCWCNPMCWLDIKIQSLTLSWPKPPEGTIARNVNERVEWYCNGYIYKIYIYMLIKALQQCAWPKHQKQPQNLFSFGLAREGSQHYNTRLGEKIPSCAELKGKSSWNANHKTKSHQKQGKGGVNHITHLFPPICCIFSNSNCRTP